MTQSHRHGRVLSRIFIMLLGIVVLQGCTPVAAPSAVTPPPPAAAAIGAFLADLATATTDPVRWATLLDPEDPGFVDAATRLRANLAQFEVDFIAAGPSRPVGEHRVALLGPTARAHAVRVRWAVPGEPAPAEHLVWLTLTNTAQNVRLAGLGDGPRGVGARPIWWAAPVLLHHRGQVAVIASPATDPEPWLAALHNASATLADHGLNRAPLVVEIPGTASGFEQMLGVPAGSHRQIAATAWPFGPTVRIVVNPGAGGATQGAARQVLLTHEAVHAASGSVNRPIPLWLAEGYADLIALSDRPGVSATHLAQLTADQRRYGPATTLVTAAELAADHPRVHANYQRAWLTAVVLDRGQGAAGRVHAAVVGGTPIQRALAAENWTEAELAAAVQSKLRRLVDS